MFQILKRLKWLFVFLILFLFIIFLLSRGCVYSADELRYGVTFSEKQATALGLDPKEIFVSILDDLKVRRLRLSAYWDEAEPKQDEYSWKFLDWMISEAAKRDTEIILAVGGRLPRWPECHFPVWAEALTEKEREKEIGDYIAAVISRYKKIPQIVAWQVENEPFLPHFGECPDLNKEFLNQEIQLVKALDQRPILLTDSGELSLWIPAARRADIFGTTMYRDTYSKALNRYIHYPIEPGFFRFKKNVTRLFTRPEKWLVIELQAEPWGPVPFQDLSKDERDRTMNLTKFREIIEFSSQTGFREFYLWGVEWWYWEREANGDAALWNESKKLFEE
ncbi:beta-galactosidase [Candidatus Parcubacteria bacterium]|nr:beta-galactosidase [Candidatus Parcubacteria bacterium]